MQIAFDKVETQNEKLKRPQIYELGVTQISWLLNMCVRNFIKNVVIFTVCYYGSCGEFTYSRLRNTNYENGRCPRPHLEIALHVAKTWTICNSELSTRNPEKTRRDALLMERAYNGKFKNINRSVNTDILWYSAFQKCRPAWCIGRPTLTKLMDVVVPSTSTTITLDFSIFSSISFALFSIITLG